MIPIGLVLYTLCTSSKIDSGNKITYWWAHTNSNIWAVPEPTYHSIPLWMKSLSHSVSPWYSCWVLYQLLSVDKWHGGMLRFNCAVAAWHSTVLWIDSTSEVTIKVKKMSLDCSMKPLFLHCDTARSAELRTGRSRNYGSSWCFFVHHDVRECYSYSWWWIVLHDYYCFLSLLFVNTELCTDNSLTKLITEWTRKFTFEKFCKVFRRMI